MARWRHKQAQLHPAEVRQGDSKTEGPFLSWRWELCTGDTKALRLVMNRIPGDEKQGCCSQTAEVLVTEGWSPGQAKPANSRALVRRSRGTCPEGPWQRGPSHSCGGSTAAAAARGLGAQWPTLGGLSEEVGAAASPECRCQVAGLHR